MPLIHLTTFIAAPLERVFDLSRSIDLHKFSMKDFNERPINGKLTGFIELNETITWTAKHLFKQRMLKVKITALQKPVSFIDEQVEGDFKKMKHEHFFKPCENGTIMIDQFYFESPFGPVGKWFSQLYLSSYMKKLLEKRNVIIKRVAETNEWKHYLPGKS